MIKCQGCGIILQDKDEKKLGFTPNINNSLCQRCFKLKNYNELTTKGITINNEELITKINNLNHLVLFLIDFINLDNEVINIYKKITCNKILILTKIDIVPKNIKYNKLINNIKEVYDIKEDIILCSAKTNFNINKIKNICAKESVILSGFTNAGKSSLINTLTNSDITVSNKSNTTQDFIEIAFDGTSIYDAPGFMSNTKRESIPKSSIRPKSYQFPSKHYLEIAGIKLNIAKDTNFTIYASSQTKILRRKEKEKVTCNIIVPKNSDVILKGVCFINFKNTSMINLSTTDYEIRPSIVGDYYD